MFSCRTLTTLPGEAERGRERQVRLDWKALWKLSHDLVWSDDLTLLVFHAYPQNRTGSEISHIA